MWCGLAIEVENKKGKWTCASFSYCNAVLIEVWSFLFKTLQSIKARQRVMHSYCDSSTSLFEISSVNASLQIQ